MGELLTAETLSDWLASAGTLPRGTVTDVRVELEYETYISKLIFLTVEYSADAPTDLPRAVVVKTPSRTKAYRNERSRVLPSHSAPHRNAAIAALPRGYKYRCDRARRSACNSRSSALAIATVPDSLRTGDRCVSPRPCTVVGSAYVGPISRQTEYNAKLDHDGPERSLRNLPAS